MPKDNFSTSMIKKATLILGITVLMLMVFYFGLGLTPAGQAFMHSSERLYYFLSGGIMDFVRTGLSAFVHPLSDLIVPAVNAVIGLTANIISFVPTLAVAVPWMFVAISVIQCVSAMYDLYKAVHAENTSTDPEKNAYLDSKKKDAAFNLGANLLIGVGITCFFLLGIPGPAFLIVLTVGFSALLLHNLYRARYPLLPSPTTGSKAAEVPEEIIPSSGNTNRVLPQLGIDSVSYEDPRPENVTHQTTVTEPSGGSLKEINPPSQEPSSGRQLSAAVC